LPRGAATLRTALRLRARPREAERTAAQACGALNIPDCPIAPSTCVSVLAAPVWLQLIPPEVPPGGGRPICGKAARRSHSLIDDIVAIRVLFARQLQRFRARLRPPCRSQIHRVEAQPDQFGAETLAPGSQRRNVILRAWAIIPSAPMQVG